jgi:hypothetical protein
MALRLVALAGEIAGGGRREWLMPCTSALSIARSSGDATAEAEILELIRDQGET